MVADAVDYYSVLQVHPDADPEVIDAAYRQLMKKYHPDVAGQNPQAASEHHRRSIAINQAYAVLRDAEARRQYDRGRFTVGLRVGDGKPSWAQPPRADRAGARPTEPTEPTSSTPTDRPTASAPPPVVPFESEARAAAGGLAAPVAWLSSAYYLLPGPYEWDRGRRGELTIVLLVPVLGVAGFLLGTGRLNSLIGTSLSAGLLAWGLLVLLSLPLWQALPRVALAVVPSVLSLNADALGVLSAVHLPSWAIWSVLSLVSLVGSARLYVFSVLPTLGICWLVARLF